MDICYLGLFDDDSMPRLIAKAWKIDPHETDDETKDARKFWLLGWADGRRFKASIFVSLPLMQDAMFYYLDFVLASLRKSVHAFTQASRPTECG